MTSSDRMICLRIIDANLNRASEGLRVVEEYVRFGLDDRHLARLCKQSRHELAETFRAIPPTDLATARDTAGDVGTEIGVETEYQRTGLADIWRANLKRVQQSLRSLEEYVKTLDGQFAQAAQRLEAIRYQTYTLEKAIGATSQSVDLFADRCLYVLVDGRSSVAEFEQLVDQLLAAKVGVIQLRDKGLNDRELLGRARTVRRKTESSDTLFIMNDRPDLAALSAADGVHVGQEELAVSDARRIVGAEALVGVSTHSIEQARQAVLDGADYIGAGPTFPSTTKNFEEFPGLEFLKQVAEEIALPAFAIGGITYDSLDAVWASGVHRIAVSGCVVNAPNPEQAATQLRERLRQLGSESRQ